MPESMNKVGLLAEFESTAAILHAATVVRDAGSAQNVISTAPALAVCTHPNPVFSRNGGCPGAPDVSTAVFQRSLLNTVQAKKSGKRKQKLNRSLKKRQEQSERDRQNALTEPNLLWDDTDDLAWQISVAATQPLVPLAYQSTRRESGRNLRSLGAAADTLFPNANTIEVRYDEDAPSRLSKNKRVGQLAQTFVHELAVHGQHAGGLREDEPDEHHDEMHDPQTRTPYVQAVQQAVRALQNEYQRKAFINAWNNDMLFQISSSETIGKQEKRRRRQWVKTTRLKLLKDQDVN